MKMFSWTRDELAYEPDYNTHARRIFPFPGVEEPDWGGAWCVIAPGETSTPHDHDEKEMFFVIDGDGVIRMGDEERRIGRGDTIFVTPDVRHKITNDGETDLLFLSIWWDSGVAPADVREREAAVEA